MTTRDDDVSPYLRRPLRSYAECLRELNRQKPSRALKVRTTIEGNRIPDDEAADDR